jgi:hypothetical protein
MYHLPSGCVDQAAVAEESQRSSRVRVWTMGLYGENSQGPSAWRLRAEMTLWLVAGPAVPPSATLR